MSSSPAGRVPRRAGADPVPHEARERPARALLKDTCARPGHAGTAIRTIERGLARGRVGGGWLCHTTVGTSRPHAGRASRHTDLSYETGSKLPRKLCANERKAQP
jgi:hypothetical protein